MDHRAANHLLTRGQSAKRKAITLVAQNKGVNRGALERRIPGAGDVRTEDPNKPGQVGGRKGGAFQIGDVWMCVQKGKSDELTKQNV